MKTTRSWIDLIAFCIAAALTTSLGSAVLLAGASVAFSGSETLAQAETPTPQTVEATGMSAGTSQATAAASASDTQNFFGLITDEICGPRHDMGSGRTAAECANMCASSGAKYALINGDRKFALDGNPEDIAKFAGQRVTVAGVSNGSNIRMTSIAAH